MWKKILPVLSAGLLLAGCATTSFTNLTSLQQPHNPNNLYPVEVAFNTQQQSLRWESIQPYVLANGASYPLRPVPFVRNRWQGLVPVPPGANTVTFRYKFDYKYNDFGGAPRPDSAYSPAYRLHILGQ